MAEVKKLVYKVNICFIKIDLKINVFHKFSLMQICTFYYKQMKCEQKLDLIKNMLQLCAIEITF